MNHKATLSISLLLTIINICLAHWWFPNVHSSGELLITVIWVALSVIYSVISVWFALADDEWLKAVWASFKKRFKFWGSQLVAITTVIYLLIAGQHVGAMEPVAPAKAQPQFSACGVFVGIIVLAGSVYIIIKLDQCINHVLSPATNSPPQPPSGTNKPSLKKSETKSAIAPTGNPSAVLEYGKFAIFHDWSTNTTALDQSGHPYDQWYEGLMPVRISTNLVTWSSDYSVVGWFNSADFQSVEVYYWKGTPVATNWNGPSTTNLVNLNCLCQDGSQAKFVRCSQ